MSEGPGEDGVPATGSGSGSFRIASRFAGQAVRSLAASGVTSRIAGDVLGSVARLDTSRLAAELLGTSRIASEMFGVSLFQAVAGAVTSPIGQVVSATRPPLVEEIAALGVRRATQNDDGHENAPQPHTWVTEGELSKRS